MLLSLGKFIIIYSQQSNNKNNYLFRVFIIIYQTVDYTLNFNFFLKFFISAICPPTHFLFIELIFAPRKRSTADDP